MHCLRRKKSSASEIISDTMIVKVHRSQGKIMLAICDSDLIGKKYEEKELQLDLTSDFYKGTKEPKEKLELLVKAASMMHFVGKKSVNYGIKEGLIEKSNVGKIKGIPHAQCVRI